jgi:putative transposase
VIALAWEKPEDHGLPIATWTSEELRQVAIEEKIVPDISRRHISRILADADLKPHRIPIGSTVRPTLRKRKRSLLLTRPINRPKGLKKRGF